MSESVNIYLDLGDGLYTDGNDKLDLGYVDNGNMYLETNTGEEGIYVNDLNGADGPGGTSTYDGYTTISGIGRNISNPSEEIPFIDIDRDVVNLIFTFGFYKVQSRQQASITYSTSAKSIGDLCNEINAPCVYNVTAKTSYRPIAGEIIQLVDHPSFRTVAVSGGTIAVESGNRHDDNTMVTKAMFVITSIRYKSDVGLGNDYIVHDMNVQCIYSDSSAFTVGQSYYGAASNV